MGYVMVPVPSELESEVKRVIAELGLRDYMTNWSEDAISEVITAAEPTELESLTAVVTAQLTGQKPALSQLAEDLNMTAVDVEEVVKTLNRRANDLYKRPLLMIGVPAEEDAGPDSTKVFLLGTSLEHVATVLGLEATADQIRFATR